jgi:hypothetical protein
MGTVTAMVEMSAGFTRKAALYMYMYAHVLLLYNRAE